MRQVFKGGTVQGRKLWFSYYLGQILLTPFHLLMHCIYVVAFPLLSTLSCKFANLKNYSRVMPSSIQQILFSILLCLDLKILLCLAGSQNPSLLGFPHIVSAGIIQGRKVLIVETIQGRKLFKEGNYSRKYGT